MPTITRGLIEIYQDHNGWLVDFTQTTAARTLRAAFSTTIIPSAYTRAMPGAAVRTAVQELYPHAAVRIRENEAF